MKIALLIAGEPRYLSECLDHIKFLSNDGVDVYFSLWESSAHTLPLLKNPIQPFALSAKQLREDICRNCKLILIEPPNPNFKSNFHRFIHRLQTGCDLISNDYDAIIIMRPDIKSHSPWELKLDPKDSIHHYYAEGNCLGDGIMIGRTRSLKAFIAELDADNVVSTDLVDWHLYLHSVAMKHFSNSVLLKTWAEMYRHEFFTKDRFRWYDTFRSIDYLVKTNFAIHDHWSDELKAEYTQLALDFKAGKYDDQIRQYMYHFGERDYMRVLER